MSAEGQGTSNDKSKDVIKAMPGPPESIVESIASVFGEVFGTTATQGRGFIKIIVGAQTTTYFSWFGKQ